MTESLEELVSSAAGGERAALEALVAAVRDDVFHLSLRTLGLRADAEDATQGILIQMLTHLSQFRRESSFRTWVWSIAWRHLMRFKKTDREKAASFENIEQLIALGDTNPPPLDFPDAEQLLLAKEVKLSCTSAMVMSLDRPHRITWILAEIFGLSSDEGARVAEVDPATYRKRLQRARAAGRMDVAALRPRRAEERVPLRAADPRRRRGGRRGIA